MNTPFETRIRANAEQGQQGRPGCARPRPRLLSCALRRAGRFCAGRAAAAASAAAVSCDDGLLLVQVRYWRSNLHFLCYSFCMYTRILQCHPFAKSHISPVVRIEALPRPNRRERRGRATLRPTGCQESCKRYNVYQSCSISQVLCQLTNRACSYIRIYGPSQYF